MYHLAWVPTVTPSGEAHSSYADKHSAKWVFRIYFHSYVLVYFWHSLQMVLFAVYKSAILVSVGHVGKVTSLQPSLGPAERHARRHWTAAAPRSHSHHWQEDRHHSQVPVCAQLFYQVFIRMCTEAL